MFRMLIVDDEPDIREGLHQFDWAQLGIEVAGCCENGLEALKLLSEAPCDIVLTDIRMPLMDGLELASRVKQLFPYTKCVILSGYDDFEYVRGCMQQGVIDYLLKPVKPEVIASTFARVTQLLHGDKQTELRQAALERKSQLLAEVLRKQLLESIFAASMDQQQFEARCAEAEMFHAHTQSAYTVCYLRFDREPAMNRKEWELALFTLGNVLAYAWDQQGYGYHIVREASGDCALLHIHGNDGSDLEKTIKEIRNQLYRFRGLLRTTFTIAVGSTVHKPEDIHLSYQIAGFLLARAEKAGDCVQYDSSIESENAIQLIEKAKAYIHQNYQRSITLSDVAGHVHLNPSYLSYLFKEVTQENYAHYVSTYRIRQAERLLQAGCYKVYEVCEMVGYENPRYFSALFKKLTGQTPYEYKVAAGLSHETE